MLYRPVRGRKETLHPLLVLTLPLLIAVALGADAVAQDKKRVCHICKGTGKVPSKSDPLPEGVVHDSHYYRNDPDLGVGFSVCKRQPTPEAEREYNAIRDEHEAWLAKVEEFEKTTGNKVVAVEGTHFVVYNELRKVRVMGKRCDQVKAARRYLELMNKVYARYCEIFDVDPDDELHKPKHTLYLHKDNDSLDQMRRKFDMSLGEGAGFTRIRSDLAVFATRHDEKPDEDLEQRAVWGIASLILVKFERMKLTPAWLQEGFRSFMEYDFYKSNKNFSFVEIPPDDPFKDGDSWRKQTKKEVAKGDFLSLVEFHGKDLASRTWRDAAYGRAYVTFLINYDPEKFRLFMKVLKRTDKDTMAAIQEIYEWLPAELDEEFRTWIRAKY